ncbi:MAG: nucleotidyl transferase AbiEii/AbiGii toxin family protein [Thermodesulfobacteriota bacterium]
MHPDVINSSQQRLLDLIPSFSNSFYLAGGTAIALQTGYRCSIDFDLFSAKELDTDKIINTIIGQSYAIEHILHRSSDELTIAVQTVRLSFVHYPFLVQTPVWFRDIIAMPDLLTLGAMKAYALGRRAKWKDYVDLYFLLLQHVSFTQLVSQAKNIFAGAFNERLFREQLCYFEDIDYTEQVDFMLQSPPSDKEIRSFLTNIATS